MSSTEGEAIETQVCARCGALCSVDDSKCWMCGSVPNATFNPYSVEIPETRPAGDIGALLPKQQSRFRIAFDFLFLVLIGLCVLEAIVVGIGIAVDSPGGLIVYLIVVCPAFLVTGVRTLWRYQETGSIQPGKAFLSLVVNFMVTLAVLGLLVVAAILLLFFVCLGAISDMR